MHREVGAILLLCGSRLLPGPVLVLGLVGVEAALAKTVIYACARECVERRVGLLAVGQRRLFPVCQPLVLADALSEHDAIDARQRVVDDAESLDVLLHVHEPLRPELGQPAEVQEVVVH